ncbi:hypothetical protein A374_18139 [Fictibacillus macauensis ZFHKF-1]|uniref:YesK-like protein n=1 Tax=Fictibacillus macauensis ZFHKF-1 TaxID=1196324 RepID=I8IWZ3_9BACL|nr:hypothetical protein [Fictibacillus macauensis]EIT83981.1 hypothetical protein A374_18139 [Fictibacillus macauensis ZFHKF-1]
MMLLPAGIGLIIGIIILAITARLHKKRSTMSKVPSIIGMVAFILAFSYGYFIVRGFEGAAYLLFAVPVLVLSLVAFFSVRKHNAQTLNR